MSETNDYRIFEVGWPIIWCSTRGCYPSVTIWSGLQSLKGIHATSSPRQSAFTVTQDYLTTGHAFVPAFQKCHISPSQWNDCAKGIFTARQTEW